MIENFFMKCASISPTPYASFVYNNSFIGTLGTPSVEPSFKMESVVAF